VLQCVLLSCGVIRKSFDAYQLVLFVDYSVVHCVTESHDVALQCVAVCCSVLLCVRVCCSGALCYSAS